MAFLRQNAYSKTLKCRLRKSLLVLTPQSVSSRWTFLSKKSPKSLCASSEFFHASHSRERKKERETTMRFQVVNCPSQVYYYSQREIFLSFSLSRSLCVFAFFFRFRATFCFRRLVFVFVFVRESHRKRNWKCCRSLSLCKFSLKLIDVCASRVTLNVTGFSPDKLRVRLPIGLLRKMYQQSAHRAKRHRPLRETARQHSPRAHWLKRSAKETLASEHRGRDSSAPIPNTRHVDQ